MNSRGDLFAKSSGNNCPNRRGNVSLGEPNSHLQHPPSSNAQIQPSAPLSKLPYQLMPWALAHCRQWIQKARFWRAEFRLGREHSTPRFSVRQEPRPPIFVINCRLKPVAWHLNETGQRTLYHAVICFASFFNRHKFKISNANCWLWSMPVLKPMSVSSIRRSDSTICSREKFLA